MGYIQVLPEFGLVADPVVGLVTTAGASLAPILDEIGEVEKIADDIVGMLSGEGNFLASFPHREKSLVYAGSVTAMWYGMAVGLLIAGLFAFALI
ncbi:Tetrahydromethanopterin S-methyltransferase subunit B [Methanolacinia petrolearia DSM 11571]|jgi:tetrahydromethanopterin S-methyltransferase subunit B|uniref:Tetrahydromethanopterin S-methyltransferase subunit B n=1 Tax=Methanolacinia petrolearia (strain DSM 11571 / OCM 486 / SEBR 4847) TaxID=679926 RepID=E1RDX0_METP4|nr:tetrahydromethanopterin S-methyltransferase subunit B [Methanolacinia petrolearia]ADN37157.1 Tetrahydromethanopterin S-methyltransferase subunit B [Methanolacinia petrolearia DSM 11571]